MNGFSVKLRARLRGSTGRNIKELKERSINDSVNVHFNAYNVHLVNKLIHFRSGLVYFRSGLVNFSRSMSDWASGLKS